MARQPAPRPARPGPDPGHLPLRRRRRARTAARAHARRTVGGPVDDAVLPAVRGPVHPGVLRPPLQRALDRCARRIDDVGEPHRGCRCPARAALVRAVGGARPFVRRAGRARVRPALPRAGLTPRAARHGRRQSLGAAERVRGTARTRLRPGEGGAGAAVVQRRIHAPRVLFRSSRRSGTRTSTAPALPCWRAN